MTYDFSPRYLLDFLVIVSTLDVLVTRSDATKTILFTLLNYKVVNNCHHQSLFMNIGKWALLQLHKKYSIPATIEVIKKLTQ